MQSAAKDVDKEKEEEAAVAAYRPGAPAVGPCDEGDYRAAEGGACDRGFAHAVRAQSSPGGTQRGENTGSLAGHGMSLQRHSSKVFCPIPYPTGKRRRNPLRNTNSFWQMQLEDVQIGVGTVGLNQNEQRKKSEAGDNVLYLNGLMMVKSAAHIRRMKEYTQWREKHSNLFSTMREQSIEEREKNRKRRLFEKLRKREQAEEAYALGVKRLRRRGWSILGKEPRPVNRLRMMQIESERNAVRAEIERVTIRKLNDASKLRDNIAQQLATCKREETLQQKALRRAARLNRAQQNRMRDQLSASLKSRTEYIRAQSAAARGYFHDCVTAEEKQKKLHQAALREHVLSKASTDGLGSTWSSSFGRTNGTKYSQCDWRSTFRSPLPTLPNASDDAYRKQFLADMQEERLALARAEVQHVKQAKTTAAQDAAYRENFARAEALRSESQELVHRRLQQESELKRFHKTLRRHRAEEIKCREKALNELRDEKMRSAADQRRAIKAEELMAKALEEEELQQLWERTNRSNSPAARAVCSWPPTPTPTPLVEM